MFAFLKGHCRDMSCCHGYSQELALSFLHYLEVERENRQKR